MLFHSCLKRWVFPAVVIYAVLAQQQIQGASYGDLLRYIPKNVNALVLIDVESLRYRTNGHEIGVERQFAVHREHVPDGMPDLSQMVMAAETGSGNDGTELGDCRRQI